MVLDDKTKKKQKAEPGLLVEESDNEPPLVLSMTVKIWRI